MAGRGGRGAQLLQALEMPARKPKNVGQYPEGKYHMNGAPQSGPGQQQYPGPRQSYAQQPQPGRRGGQYPVRGHYSPQGQYPPQGQYSQQQPQPNAQYPSQGQEHSPGQYSPQGQYPPQGSCPPQGQYPVRGSYQYGPPQAQQPGVYHAPGGRGSMQLGVQPRVPPPMGRGMMPQMPSSQPTGRPPSQTAGQPAYGRGAAVLASYGRDAPVNGQAQLSGMEAHVRQPHSTVQPCGRGYQPSPAPSKQFPLGPQQTVQPPTQALQEMTLREKSSAVLAPITQTGEKGTAGKTVPLAVNCIPIRCKVDGVYQYCVSYSPDVDSRNMRYKLLCDHADFLGGTRAFDGIALFLPRKLQDQPTILKSTRPTDGAEITLSIQMVKFLAPDQCVQLYNIIFRKVMRTLQMYQVGRYYYDPTKPAQIPQHKLELWPGYITTIQHYEGGLLLLADVSHRLLRTDTVLEFLYELYNLHKNNFQEVATKTLVGTVVLTRYNNKTYRIDDIEWNKNPQDTFLFHTGERMTYVDYYKKSYNKTLCDHSQPLLVHRPKKREQTKPGARRQIEVVNLIPELCSMTGLTDAMRQDFRLMKDVAAHTRVTPMQREESTRKFLNNVSSTPEAKKHLSDWGLELDTGLLKTEGRLLPMEKIKFGSTTVSANPQADWGRDAVKENVITPVGLTSWMIVFVKRDQHKAMDFIQTMKKVTPAMGISVQDPVVLELRDDRTETYVRTIREHLNRSVQVVVIVFPTSRDDRYAAVKKLCCVDFPVPSQVINARTISQQNKLRSVTQKIALQINCKVGGELWALDIPLKSLMVVGIDLYHDASQGGRSIGGFVASTNRSLTRWYSRVCFQSPGQELVAGLKMCLTSALKKFHEVNHTLPEKIIVFRDGVGDGQLNTVGEYEVSQLAECFALFGEKYEPQMTVIVVQKRINTRIFSYETRGGQHMLDNPGPGTVLDHSVTRKDWYDFFVVSQHVRQGTVTPTHYVVVHNSSSLKPDHIQRLSYKLTHLYYNWPGTVRVPAPCQYAHKLAYLVGTSIHKDPSVHLSERLFYL